MSKGETFVACMALLADTFRQKLTDGAMEGYRIALADLTAQELQTATKSALQTSKFMPAPAELRAFIGRGGPQQQEADIANAWTTVLDAMRIHDYTTSVDFGPLVNAVVRAMGGWLRLCEESEKGLVWRAKDFKRIYESFAMSRPESIRGEPLLGAFGGRPVRVVITGQASSPLPALNGKREGEPSGFELPPWMGGAK